MTGLLDTGYRAVPDHIPEGEFDYGEATKIYPFVLHSSR